jgi:hypothetical protein
LRLFHIIHLGSTKVLLFTETCKQSICF